MAKKKKKNKYLDLSAFKDGYDFGDVTKTIVKSAKKTSKTLQKNAEKSAKSKTTNKKGKTTSGNAKKTTRLNTQIGYKPANEKKVSTKTSTKTDFLSFLDSKSSKSATRNILTGGKEERTWFNKGLFEDGYDFGDVTKTLLGTEKDLRVNVGKGLGRIGEGLVDTVAYGVGGVAKAFGNDEFADKTKKFIARDLVEEARIGEKLGRSMGGTSLVFDALEGLVNKGKTEQISVLGDKADSLVQSAGQLGGTIGLQAVGVPWWVTTGVTGFGSGTQEAFSEGATYGEAGIYGGISAGTEVAFEKIGGIKFGGKALDTGLKKQLSKAISNKVAKNLVKFGIDAGAEGTEEVLTEITQNIGRGLTFEDEKTMQELLTSEEAMDQYVEAFIGGAVMGGGFNAGKLVQSAKTGRDYDTGLTDNEQRVVNKEIENRTAEKQKKAAVETEIDKIVAERTKHLGTLDEKAKKNIREEVQAKLDNGELDFTTAKLTKKERAEIEQQVEEDLKAGYIGIDTIESTLSEAKTSRINELRDVLSKTTKDTEKSMIEAELRQLEGARAEEMKGLLGKDNFLQESYRQEVLKGESFSRETTDKDSDITKELIESAKFAGMNNTRRMHDLFDYTNKIANDTKTKYGFVNNEQLKQLGHEVEGKTINGLVRVNEDGTSKILINVDSNKAINTIIGHETTHLLEGTAEHKKLVDIVKEYATTKGDYDARLKEFENLYQGVNANIENEITADLVGDYLFTDEAFITNLSVKEPNIFQKVYDYIKHVYKMATAGSSEARQLEQVKRRFDKAYKQMRKTATDSNVKHSLSDNDYMSAVEKGDTETAQRLVDEAAKNAGYTTKAYHGTLTKGITEFKKDFIGSRYAYDDVGFFFTDNLSIAEDYAVSEFNADRKGEVISAYIKTSNAFIFDKKYAMKNGYGNIFRFADPIDVWDSYQSALLEEAEKHNADSIIVKDEQSMMVVAFEPNQIKSADPVTYDDNGNVIPLSERFNTGSNDIRYSLDTNGNELTKAQQEYFKDSKVRDDNGNLKVMYHGSEKAGFHIFDTDFTDDGRSHFFTDDNTVAKSYSGTNEKYAARTFKTAEDLNNFFAEIGVADEYEVREENGKFVFYDEGEAEATSDTAVGIYEEFRDWTGLGSGSANYEVYLNIKNPLVIESNSDSWDHVLIPKEIQEDMWEYLGERVASTNTRTYSAYAKEKGYDGVIFKRIIDTGIYASNMEKYQASTVAVAFDFDQIKSVANENPTNDPDIRFSLSKSVEETKDLIALHNLTEAKLKDALELGGMPMPSIAITKADAIDHEGFGNITLILNKESIDPKASKHNKVFSGDAYTPTFPSVSILIDEKVADGIKDKLTNILDGTNFMQISDVDFYQENMSRQLERFDTPAEAYGTDATFRIAYIKDKGLNIDIPQIEKSSEWGNSTIKAISEALGERLPMKYSGVEDTMKLEPEIRELVNKTFKEEHGVENFLTEQMGFGDIDKILNDVRNYRRKGFETRIDKRELDKVFKENVDASDYEKWINNLFEGIVKKKGIRNNKDMFTPSGNRRSWESLHNDVTLDNIIKIMRADEMQKGGAAFGGSLTGASAQEYSSIQEIKANTDKLGKLTEEELKANKDYIADTLNDIALRYANGKDWWDARNTLVEAVAKYESKRGIANYLKQYDYVYKSDESIVDDIIALRDHIRNTPTPYFEAKPRRAVTFDEVGVYVIPNNIDTSLKGKLLEAGYSIAEYDPNIEGDRNRVVNNFEEYKFSLSNNDDIAPINTNVRRETGRALTEADLPYFEQQRDEAFRNVSEDYAPVDTETYYGEEEPVNVEDPLKDRDIDEVGNRKIKAYMYENPEVKPYFQEEAEYMLTDLRNSTKGEKFYNDELYYASNGEQGFFGTKRQTTEDIAYLLDKYKYTYADIEKGLKAIIEDNGAENNAISKRIEFMLDERLREGYQSVDGYEIPPNEDYISLLANKQIKEYSDEAYEAWVRSLADVEAPAEDVAKNETEIDNLKKLAEEAHVGDYLLWKRFGIRSFEKLTNEQRIEAKEWLETIIETGNAVKTNDTPAGEVSARKVINEKPTESKPDIAPVREEYRDPYEDFLRQATQDNIKQQTAENIKAYEQESKPKPPVFQEVSPTKKSKHGIGSAVDTFYTHFVNRNRQQDKLAKQTGNKEIKFKGDRVNNIAGEIGGDIFTAQTDNYGNRIGKSLDAPFEQARKAKLDREFDDYLKHQSNIERHKQGKGSVVPVETSREYVSAYEQVHPKFKEWAKDVYTYNQNLLNNAVENGLIDKEFRAYLTGTYGHYVPFYAAEMSKPNIDVSPDEIRSGRPIKRAVGGADVTMQGVEQAMIKQTYAYMNAIAKNDLYKEIAKSVGGGGITPDVRAGDPTELKNLLYEDESGKYLTAFIKGEPYSVNISEELYTELKRDLDTQIREIEEKYGIITKPLQKISQLRGKLLTTYNPSFIVTNPIKDVQDALLNTKHTFRYIKNIGSAITDSSKVDSMDWYAERFKDLTGQDITTVTDTGNLSRRAKHYYNKYQDGAMWSRFITSYGMNATQLEYMDDIDIDIKKSSKKAKNKGFLNKLSNANNFMEVMFRYPEFKATLEKGKSFTEALYNAREVTTNFGRGGTISKAINRNGATFFNTSVQGMDKFFRNFSLENGAKGFMSTVSKAVILGMTPAILNHILLGGGYDDEYEALPEYVKSNYYLFRRGNGEFIRIPKGRMISVLGSAARLNLEASMGKVDPTIAKEVDNKEFLRNAQDQIGASNPLKENIFAPVTQALKNEAWYGDDIVPYRLQNLPAKEQYDASIDEFSKWLGEKLNVSPYKVNYVLDQYSGGIGDALLPMMTPEATSDAEGAELLLAPIRDKFVVNSTDDNRYVGELFDLSDELKVQTNSSEATLDDVMNYEYISDIASQMGELYALKREIQADETLSKSEKYEETRKVQELINELATEGVRNYNSGASIDLAYEMHPDAVVSKVYADYNTYNTYKRALWDFKADKDKNGKTIIGSKQEKIIDYLNETDLDYGERIILFRQQYKSNDTYNEDIIDYLNSRDDLYYEDVVVILESLGMTVKSDGTVEW